MPTYLRPGVYVEEVPWDLGPSGGMRAGLPVDAQSVTEPPPRWRLREAVAGFVGPAPGGPVRHPIRVPGWTSFLREFADPEDIDAGPFMPDAYLAHAVRGYFENGGTACWVVRVEEQGALAFDAALHELASIDEVTLACAPDATRAEEDDPVGLGRVDAQGRLVAHCEAHGNRLAILDAPARVTAAEVHAWRVDTAGFDSSFAALYHPWVEVLDPVTRHPLLVPPCGHVAGLYARSDRERGVHRSPANLPILGAVGLPGAVTPMDQDPLNVVGINALVLSPGRGPVIWGARTLSSDPEQRYVRTRRLRNVVAENIRRGTEYVVHGSNLDERLWRRVVRDIEDLLLLLWEAGALFGDDPDQAFGVRCDAENNPPEVLDARQLHVDVWAQTESVPLRWRVTYFVD